MKSCFFQSFAVCLLATSAFLTADEPLSNDDLQIVSISEVPAEIVNDLFTGKLPHTILECKEGTTLPFSISLTGNYLSLENTSEAIQLNILKTCYVQFIDDDVFFSDNLETWASFEDFFEGSLGFVFNVENDESSAGVYFDLNQASSK